MHPEPRDFTISVKSKFPTFFKDRRVLDVGSGDINGNNRFLFENCEYHGNDVFAAANVTVVSKTSDLQFPPDTFDTIISTECFEHDPEYKQSLQKIVNMLKPGGLFLFTCASTGRAEHGTRRSHPGCSYGTIGEIEGWQDYYKNLTFEDIVQCIDMNLFSKFEHFYNPTSCDLYFWGIKSWRITPRYISKNINIRNFVR
jgi:SAM-dependent methyltransferase